MMWLFLTLAAGWLCCGIYALRLLFSLSGTSGTMLQGLSMTPWLGWRYLPFFVIENIFKVFLIPMAIFSVAAMFAMAVAGGPISLLAYCNAMAQWERDKSTIKAK